MDAQILYNDWHMELCKILAKIICQKIISELRVENNAKHCCKNPKHSQYCNGDICYFHKKIFCYFFKIAQEALQMVISNTGNTTKALCLH